MKSLDDWQRVAQGKGGHPDPVIGGSTSLVSADVVVVEEAEPEEAEEKTRVDWAPITEVTKTIQLYCMALAAGRTTMDALIVSGDEYQHPYRAKWLLTQPVVLAELRTYVKPLLLQPDIAKVWASRHLEAIAESSITDMLEMRSEREYLRSDDGMLLLDDQARPVYRVTQRVVLKPDLMDMPRRQLQTIRKMRIKRRADGDEIEVEMYDRHKAIMDLATLAGLRPQPTPAAGETEKEVYDAYSGQLSAAEEHHAERLKKLRAITHDRGRG